MNEIEPKAVTAGRAEPGALRSEAFLEIQTRQAQKLVEGRESREDKTQAIIGMLSFGRRMRQLWLSAQSDDPYADGYLLRIEESMNQTRQSMDENARAMQQALESVAGVRIDTAHSLEPVRVALQFSNPYGYMGAYLIADYDALTRAVLTARHFALIDRDRSQSVLEGAGRAIRRTFNFAALWRYTGVTREDMRQMNPVAQRAQALMGELPPEVLEGRQRAKIAPVIKRIGAGELMDRPMRGIEVDDNLFAAGPVHKPVVKIKAAQKTDDPSAGGGAGVDMP